ncbi:PP2C family protein-serine/threonine phosphatase [Streptomyces sp. SCSIO 30461]|uniref:PP2C family protein-serine/threonine phosphatase n=1 Tax=Streptomyces sp. SCSIO 30461 TaxID=3118085 RepID=UPI0030D1919A
MAQYDGGEGPRPRSGGRVLVLLLPWLTIIAGLVFDLFTPETYRASPFFAAAPLLAAPFYTWRGTLVTTAAGVLTVLGLNVYNGTLGQVPPATEVFTVLTVSIVALYINRVLRRSGERLASARVIAEAAQRAVLPEPAERIGGLNVAARYEAAQADAFIGGDLYAVQNTAFGVRLIVGDVRGKGLDAVEAVAVLLGAFREVADEEPSLEGIAQRLERALARGDSRPHGLDRVEGFTTAVLAEIPRDGSRVRVVNRGHPPPIVMYADGALYMLEPSQNALPLGMGDLAHWPDHVDEAPFPAGATLLLYTDGLSEARDRHGTFYDPRARLGGLVFPGPDELLDAVVADVRRHTGGGLADDMALLAVARPGVHQPVGNRSVPVAS